MIACPKSPPLRDNAYRKWLRTQPCIITGIRAHDGQSVVAMHLGTAGRGIKTGDDETLPIMQYLHDHGHNIGETTMLREASPGWLLLKAFRALAREMYAEWKAGQ